MSNQIVELLESEGHLSNERFAEEYVHSRIQRYDGPLKILSALYSRGIDESLAARALLEADVNWREVAEHVFKKKLSNLDLDDPKRKVKLERFMRSRGFDYKQFQHLMKKIS